MSRALRALSSTYVERRRRIAEGAALAGAGKRAAFALFYGPLHYLLVREIVRAIPGAAAHPATIIDLGCGTGAAGAAWAASFSAPPVVVGIDHHPWAASEAAWTYGVFGLSANIQRQDIARAALPKRPASFVAAFTLNELADDEARETLLRRLVDRGARGDRVLIVEPIARSVARWWDESRRVIVEAGGRADEWRFRLELPPIVAKLDRAAGLDHRELTARSLWLGPER